MKIRLTSPTFDASAQTITHPSFSDVTLAGIQLIVNVTDQVIIYNFADTTKGGTLAGDVLTLEYNTTAMSDTDELMVLVEDGIAYQLPTGAATAANQATLIAAVDTLEALLGTIDADTGAILTAVDGIETLITSTNTKLDTVIGHVDGIETAIASTNTKLDTVNSNLVDIETAVDGLETNTASTNTKLDTLITQTDGLETSNSAIQTAVELLDDTVATLGTTTYTEATNKGVVIGAVRRDANTTLVSATNEVAPLQVNATGELKVAVIQAVPTVTTVTTVTNITNQGMGADDSAFTVGTTRVQATGFLADETATDSVDEGDMGIGRMTLDRKQIITPYVHALAGGWTPYKNIDVDESEDQIKATAGKIGWIHVMNMTAAVLYLKLYNATAASVTVGTTVPDLTFPIPTFASTNGAGFMIPMGDAGTQFTTAITVAATTGLADNDTGAPGTNAVIINAGYL